MDTKIFVYGTLKKGHGNAHILGNSHFVGNATVEGELLDIGNFPGLVAKSDSQVSGEVYWVSPDTLARLDQLEGEGRMYHRKFTLATMTGSPWVEQRLMQKVYTYYWGLSQEFPTIECGEWTKFRESFGW